MNSTILYVVAAALVLAFVLGGVAAWEGAKRAPLPPVQFSSPFRPEEAVGDLNLEYISVTNQGDAPIDLSNWTLSSSAGLAYAFPAGFVLLPGALVTIHTGCGEASEGTLYWCSPKPAWPNPGGRATLRMPDGTVVGIHNYKTSCSTCGKK